MLWKYVRHAAKLVVYESNTNKKVTDWVFLSCHVCF